MKADPQALAQIHALAQQGQVAEARVRIEQALGAFPGDPAVWHLAGVVRRRAGDLTGAIEAFRRALASGARGDAEVWNSLGLALEDSGDATGAEEAFAAAIRRRRDYVPAHVNHARILGQRGDYAAAEKALRGALTRQPDAGALLGALGSTLIHAGRSDEAEGVLRRAVAADPASRVAVIRLGQALRDQGRSAEALALYRAKASVVGASPEFTEALAAVLVDIGEWRSAEAELEALCARAPGYFAGHRALARLGRVHGSDKDCYRSFRALAAQYPGDSAVWLEWVATMVRFRDYAAALPVIAAAEARVGRLAQLDFFKALALGETGEGAAAEELFRALEASPVSAVQAYLTARARNALLLREAALAERLAAEAAQRVPHDQFALAYLGLAWRLQGDAREFWLHDYERQAVQMPLDYLGDAGERATLCDTLRALHTQQHHPPEQSLRQGTQTEGALFARPDPVIRRLREAIREAVLAYAARLPDDPAHPFYQRKARAIRFVGSWSVRLTTAGFHIAHIHEQGWISSALHLVVPERRADEAAEAGALVLGEPPVELGLGLAPRKVVTPQVGFLTLFPSSMWHGTVPFAGGDERLTVAFDVVPG